MSVEVRESDDRQVAAADRRLIGAISALTATWEQQVLPEVQRYVAEWERIEPTNLGDEALADELRRSYERLKRITYLHHKVIIPARAAMGEVEDKVLSLNGGDHSGLDALALIQGGGVRIVWGIALLWTLARSTDNLDHQRGDLKTHFGSRIARSELYQFVSEFGQEADGYGLMMPSWLEDQSPVASLMRLYAVAGESADPMTRHKIALKRRREAWRSLHQTLSRADSRSAARVKEAAGLAQHGLMICEGHGTLIHARVPFQIRRLLRAAGERLAALKVVGKWHDIFFLYRDELSNAVRGQSLNHWRGVVDRRMRERGINCADPTQEGGNRPQESHEEIIVQGLFGRHCGRLYGGTRKDTVSVRNGCLVGTPASPGKGRGPARILNSQSEISRFEPGDVLVCESGGPPFAFVFPLASAIVAQSGTEVGHCAVMAREFAVPAVVGVPSAFSAIAEGTCVEVDGDRGEIRVS